MRILLTLIALVIASGPAFAQFTMTAADYPAVGSSYQYMGLDTTGINEGMGGTGQTWDFSTATPNGFNLTIDVIDPSTHPDGASFPNATHCFTYSSNTYQFFSNTNDSLKLEGDLSLVNTAIPYSLKPTLLAFPANLNDIQQDTMYSSYNGGAVGPAVRFGNYNTIVDGDGTVMLPGGITYSNCNRVVHFAVYTDSSLAFPIATSHTQLTRVEWYVQGYPVPIMYTETREVAAGGTPNTTRSVYFIDTSVVSIDQPTPITGMQLSPNPANDQVRLSYELTGNALATIEVYNMVGDRVRYLDQGDQVAGNYQLQLSTADLARGMYMVRLTAGEFTTTKKLVLK